MFTAVAMPLTQLFAAGGAEAFGHEVHAAIEAMLSEELGRPVTWSPPAQSEAGVSYVADDIDVYALYALRALAAWVERHGSLEGFALDDAPWDSEPLLEYMGAARSERFAQLLYSEAWVAAFLPLELPTVYMLATQPEPGDEAGEASAGDEAPGSAATSSGATAHGDPDDGGEDDDDDDGELDEELGLAIGSLPALEAELRALAPLLGIDEAALEAREWDENAVFDADVDPLAAARFAWLVLFEQACTAREHGLPLLLIEEDEVDEPADEPDAPAGPSGPRAVDDLMGDVGIDDWDELE